MPPIIYMANNHMKQQKITISEGGGGKLASKLIEDVFLKSYGNQTLNQLDDSAEVLIESTRIVVQRFVGINAINQLLASA